MMNSVKRVDITPEAAAFVERLKAMHGPLLFHQSGGCCDGSAPMCYPQGDFRIGANDVFLGLIAGCPFYIGGQQFEYWRHTHLTVDIVAGTGKRVLRRGSRRKTLCYPLTPVHGRGDRAAGGWGAFARSVYWSVTGENRLDGVSGHLITTTPIDGKSCIIQEEAGTK